MTAYFASAQNANDSTLNNIQNKIIPNSINTEFVTKEIKLQQGEIVTNVLKITNNTSNKSKFRATLDFPNGWKSLFHSNIFYELDAGDSIFLPVRIMPTTQFLGNTRFMISVYVISEEDIQLSNTFFWALTEKKTSWVLNIEPSSKRYFKNNSNLTNFKVNLLNTGTESQPISLTLTNTSLYSILSDSSDRPMKNPTFNFNLKPFEDTTFTFNFKYLQGTRNYNRIDIENHKPENINEEKTYSLLVNSSEPNLGGASGFKSGQKVSFTRLSSDKTVNPFSSASLPLIVDLNVNNIFNDITFTTLNIHGVGQIAQDKMLIYNFQTTASTSNNTTDNLLANSVYYLGYYYNKGSVQTGYINGGMMGIQGYGRGLKSDYYLTTQQKIGAFYINNTGVTGSTNAYAYGLNYELKYFKSNTLNLEYGRSENSYLKTITDAYNARVGFNIYKYQSIFFNYSTTVTNSESFSPTNTKTGAYGSITYNGGFFNNKLSTTQSFGKNTKDYSNSNIERTYYNQSTRYIINSKMSIVLVNGYNDINYFSVTKPIENFTQNNLLSLNINKGNTSFQPQAFYNTFNYTINSYYSRGLGFSYSIYDVKENTRISTTVQSGYNKPFNSVLTEDRFFIQWSGIIYYRTISLNARYTMMPVNTPGTILTTYNPVTPQTFSGSLQHQYIFKNTHFVLQSGINYYYNNVYNQNSVSILPELYYYTNDGWRFKINYNYNLTSGNVYNFSNSQLVGDNTTTYVNQNTYIGLGIRKDFGVPIPFVKKKFFDVEFEAFYDLNGNGKKDKNEQPVENIVISMGNYEVITNENGEAKMRNFQAGLSYIFAKSLDASETWFANMNDSVLVNKDRTVYVPFVRGVKIKGKVGIDRESIRADATTPFDLSRIKITSNGDKSFSTLTDFEGNFEFYLPYGKYIITMDENVLGDKYKLAKNNFELEVNRSIDGMFLSYLIVERKRKIVKKSFVSPDLKK